MSSTTPDAVELPFGDFLRALAHRLRDCQNALPLHGIGDAVEVDAKLARAADWFDDHVAHRPLRPARDDLNVFEAQRSLNRELAAMVREQGRQLGVLAHANAKMARALTKKPRRKFDAEALRLWLGDTLDRAEAAGAAGIAIDIGDRAALLTVSKKTQRGAS